MKATAQKYRGAQQILMFNWTFYTAAIIVLILGMLILKNVKMPGWMFVVGVLGMALTAFWSFGSLAVSHYVYDRSPLYQLTWLNSLLETSPTNWINIHAGLDETSIILRDYFPAAKMQILDIYDPATMTEPAIERARKITEPELKSIPSDFRHLPIPDQNSAAVFVFFAAHELRTAESRLSFFREVYRILKANGTLIVVEHLRDVPNFLAFGPGFFHFLKHADWIDAARFSNFRTIEEIKITPFVSAFKFSK
jgi:ubiquinone/menaquinone biosynthesis C-methylase UbiE